MVLIKIENKSKYIYNSGGVWMCHQEVDNVHLFLFIFWIFVVVVILANYNYNNFKILWSIFNWPKA